MGQSKDTPTSFSTGCRQLQWLIALFTAPRTVGHGRTPANDMSSMRSRHDLHGLSTTSDEKSRYDITTQGKGTSSGELIHSNCKRFSLAVSSGLRQRYASTRKNRLTNQSDTRVPSSLRHKTQSKSQHHGITFTSTDQDNSAKTSTHLRKSEQIH